MLIPCHNAAKTISATLDSCLASTRTALASIIVIDDHSSDDSWSTVTAWAKDHPGVDLRLRRAKGRGACDARNQALELSEAIYVQWLDADDLLGEGSIERALTILSGRTDWIVVTPWQKFRDQIGDGEACQWSCWTDGAELTPRQWLNRSPMTIPAGVLASRQLFIQAGLWDNQLLIDQDGEFMVRVVACCAGVTFSTSRRVHYRRPGTPTVSTLSPAKVPSLLRSAQSFEAVYGRITGAEGKREVVAERYTRALYAAMTNPVPRSVAQECLASLMRLRPGRGALQALAPGLPGKILFAIFPLKMYVLIRWCSARVAYMAKWMVAQDR